MKAVYFCNHFGYTWGMNQVTDNKKLAAKASKAIQFWMDDRAWTQGEMARRLFSGDDSVSKRMIISRWYRGERCPDGADLLNLAEVFGVPVEDFLACKKNPKKRSA